jgi:hypothetical protein
MSRRLLILLAASQIGAAIPASSGPNTFEPVSMIAIIANPERFDGKRVRVDGFLILEFEGNALYLDKDAHEGGLTKNAVWIDAPAWADTRAQKRLTGRYAHVEGTFNPRHHGHLGLWSGALEDVHLIQPTFTTTDFRREKFENSDAVLRQAMVPGLIVFFSLLIAFSLLNRLRIWPRPRP